MVGLQVPQGTMTTAKYSAVSSPSMFNRASRGLVTNFRMQLQIRNGNHHGRIHVGVGGGWPKSLRMDVKKLQLYKLQSFGFHGGSQSTGFRYRHSRYSTRAGISLIPKLDTKLLYQNLAEYILAGRLIKF